MITYAVYSKDEKERLSSSSGGVFSLLAKAIFESNGVVYGVSMTEDNRSAKFLRAENEDTLARIRGSKYFQAHVGNIYRNVKIDLDNEILVLFSGTACQINGLKLFLRKDYNNLICVDVVCHGTPSPALWGKYVSYMEEKHGGKMADVRFRCKDYSWNSFDIKKTIGGKQVLLFKNEDPFMTMFLRDYCLRPSCYKCLAKNEKMSDITLADFWGIHNVAPEMNDDKGTSLVICRTEKGQRIFESIMKKMVRKKVSYEEGVKGNTSEFKSSIKPVQRNTFFEDMNTVSFEELKHKYCKPTPISTIERCKRFAKSILIKILGKSKTDKISWNNYGLLFRFEEEN